MAAERTDGGVRSGRDLGVDIRAEDDPVVAEKQQRVDVLCRELVASGGRRSDDA